MGDFTCKCLRFVLKTGGVESMGAPAGTHIVSGEILPLSMSQPIIVVCVGKVLVKC